MPRPSPEDQLKFFQHLAENHGKPFSEDTLNEVTSDNPSSADFDRAFFSSFPASQVKKEVANAVEYENFFKQHETELELADFNQTQKQILEQRREMLLKVLSLLEWAKKADQIPENTTLDSLFKWVSSQVVKMSEANKDTFSNEDRDALYLLKALVELKEEGMEGNRTIPDIIEALDKKYESIKGVS